MLQSNLPQIVVRPIGAIPHEILQNSCQWIQADLNLDCSTGPSFPFEDKFHRAKQLNPAWNAKQHQFDGKELLNQLFYHRSQKLLHGQRVAPIELWISVDDIYEGQRPFVFGLTSLTDRLALVSTARLAIDGPAGPLRLRKLVLHELGHAFGLHHHDISDCVMRVDGSVESLDHAPLDMCLTCQGFIASRIESFQYPNNTTFELALGHLARAEITLADKVARDFKIHEQPHFSLQLGIAFARMRANSYAIAWFKYSLEYHKNQESFSSADRAPLHLALARSFERRGKDHGDILSAEYHFELAATLRPNWKLAQDELQRFLSTHRRFQLALARSSIPQ